MSIFIVSKRNVILRSMILQDKIIGPKKQFICHIVSHRDMFITHLISSTHRLIQTISIRSLMPLKGKWLNTITGMVALLVNCCKLKTFRFNFEIYRSVSNIRKMSSYSEVWIRIRLLALPRPMAVSPPQINRKTKWLQTLSQRIWEESSPLRHRN